MVYNIRKTTINFDKMSLNRIMYTDKCKPFCCKVYSNGIWKFDTLVFLLESVVLLLTSGLYYFNR